MVIVTTIFLIIKIINMEQKDPTVIVPVSMKLSQKEKIKKKAVEQHRTVSSFMTVKALDIVNF